MLINGTRKDIPFVNTVKVFAIFLVVLGHLSISNEIYSFINIFHMPVFFLISGYLMSGNSDSFFIFTKKKAKALLIPYIFFAFVTFFFWYFVGRKYGNDSLDGQNTSVVLKHIIGIFLAIPSKDYLGFNFPIWFLPSLFCAEIIFYGIRKYFKKVSFLMCLIAFSVGVLLNKMQIFRLPFGIDVSFFALLFIFMGNWLRKNNLVETYICNKKLIYKMFFTILFGALTFYISHINSAGGTISMVHRVFNNYFLYLVGAFSGILCILFLSNCMPNHRLFHFYGRNTIFILGFHLMCFSLLKAIQVFVFHIPAETANGGLFINVMYAIFTFILLAPVIYLINKYAPFIVGREKGVL